MPRVDNVARVVSRPFDSYAPKDVRARLDADPDWFVHVIRPEHRAKRKSPPNSMALFQKSRDRFETMLQDGIFAQSEMPAFYVYTQHDEGQSFTGIVGTVSVQDYDNGVIRIHEQTLASRERVLKEYLSVVRINAEPVCFTYPRQAELETLTAQVLNDAPLFDFEDDLGRRHELRPVRDEELVEAMTAAFSELPHIYVADGHHRSASSVLYAHEQRQQAGDAYTGTEPWNRFMGIFFPDDQLRICEFNRAVRDLGEMDEATFLKRLEEDFIVDPSEDAYSPEEAGCFGMYLSGKWYGLRYRHARSEDVVAALDVSILSDRILAPLLQIHDLRHDKRIQSVPGTKGLRTLERLVDTGQFRVAFSLFPLLGSQFYAISDQGRTMPPKSTYVVPKLLSGLTVFEV